MPNLAQMELSALQSEREAQTEVLQAGDQSADRIGSREQVTALSVGQLLLALTWLMKSCIRLQAIAVSAGGAFNADSAPCNFANSPFLKVTGTLGNSLTVTIKCRRVGRPDSRLQCAIPIHCLSVPLSPERWG